MKSEKEARIYNKCVICSVVESSYQKWKLTKCFECGRKVCDNCICYYENNEECYHCKSTEVLHFCGYDCVFFGMAHRHCVCKCDDCQLERLQSKNN